LLLDTAASHPRNLVIRTNCPRHHAAVRRGRSDPASSASNTRGRYLYGASWRPESFRASQVSAASAGHREVVVSAGAFNSPRS
jgi:hypothetical protein